MFQTLKASRLFIRSGSFFLLLLLSTTLMSAAEVRRSLSLEDRIRLLEQQLSAANRLRAETQFEITNLKNEVRDLRGAVEEQGYQLEQIIKRQRELYRDIDQRLSESTNASSDSSSVVNNVDNNTANNSKQTSVVENSTSNTDSAYTEDTNNVTATNDTPVPVVAKTDDEIRGIYDKIFPLVRSKRYDEAISGYQQFISQFPESIYVANSHYWLAQIFTVQGRSDEAEREYLNVAQNHSSSSKAADAWLKLGKLYEDKNDTSKAVNAYNQVITQYANSTAAQLAVSRLQTLKSSD